MWVARDKGDILFLYASIPSRREAIFEPNDGSCMDIDSDLFSNLKFEDEPIQVSLCSLKELNRLNEIDWNYQDLKETCESYEKMIYDYRKLPWYKRIFVKI